MNTLNATQLKQWKEEDRPFLLVNVLGKDAFEKQHIPGSMNLPVDQPEFADEVSRRAGTRDRPIVVYCASTECDASERAAKQLEEAGFTNVYDFEGGMQAWKEDSEQPAGNAASRSKGI